MRLFMYFLIRFVLSPHTRDFYAVTTCSTLHELYTTHSHPLSLISQNYPVCENTLLGLSTHEIYIPVQLGYYPPERIAMTITMVFGTSGWLAMVLHMVGVEWWLHWSANESKKYAMKVKKWWNGAQWKFSRFEVWYDCTLTKQLSYNYHEKSPVCIYLLINPAFKGLLSQL